MSLEFMSLMFMSSELKVYGIIKNLAQGKKTSKINR
jgi:hypothetical protein